MVVWVFHGFVQSVQAYAQIVPSSMLQILSVF